MKRVILESPFRGNGDSPGATELYKIYTNFCMRDMLLNYNEAPFASHAIYTLPHVLDDTVADERRLGIESGFLWGLEGDYAVVYVDLGLSEGMKEGIENHLDMGLDVFFRDLGPLWNEFEQACLDKGYFSNGGCKWICRDHWSAGEMTKIKGQYHGE